MAVRFSKVAHLRTASFYRHLRVPGAVKPGSLLTRLTSLSVLPCIICIYHCIYLFLFFYFLQRAVRLGRGRVGRISRGVTTQKNLHWYFLKFSSLTPLCSWTHNHVAFTTIRKHALLQRPTSFISTLKLAKFPKNFMHVIFQYSTTLSIVDNSSFPQTS